MKSFVAGSRASLGDDRMVPDSSFEKSPQNMKSTLLLFCFWCILQASSFADDRAAKPNVLVLLADDQGWGDLSLNGNTNLSTPNIDALGRAGAIFHHFYVCPVCSPTRAEFLTGRYHPRGGVRDVTTGQERLNPDEKTIADTFK